MHRLLKTHYIYCHDIVVKNELDGNLNVAKRVHDDSGPEVFDFMT